MNDFTNEAKAEIITKILAEVEANGSARVGQYADEVLKRANPIPYNIKSKIEATIVASKKYKSRPHPRFKHDFEIMLNPDFSEEKENLTMQQLRSANMLLTEQLIDFPKVKRARNIAIGVSITIIIVNIVLYLIRK